MYQISVDGALAYEIDDVDDARRKQAELQRVYPGASVTVVNTFSDTGRTLGSIRTPRKTESSRANLAKAHAGRTPKPCDCGQEPHRYTCPVYHREAQRRSRASKV